MTRAGTSTRLEALCDGVFAIALTLLILDVRVTSPESIGSTAQLWRALQHLTPALFAFVLSFGIILITWVNHHAMLEMIDDSSAAFLYANGFLLLTVVSLPFPTGLLGDFLWTNHAAPAVVLYDAVLALQAIGWSLVSGVALKGQLTRDERATAKVREAKRNGYFAFALYAGLAVLAVWIPLVVAIATTVSWGFWLALGIRMKRA